MHKIVKIFGVELTMETGQLAAKQSRRSKSRRKTKSPQNKVAAKQSRRKTKSPQNKLAAKQTRRR